MYLTCLLSMEHSSACITTYCVGEGEDRGGGTGLLGGMGVLFG